MKIQKTIFYLASILSIALGGNQVAFPQATATGSVTMTGPGGHIQSVSGQISLPAGKFNGPLVITPNFTLPASIDPIDSLLIDPGGIDFNVPPTTLNSQAAALLNSASSLSDIVSIIRANSNLFDSGSSSNQATATGSTTLVYPDGSTQSVSGEVTLPAGLYYEGSETGGCTGPSGCLWIDPVMDALATEPSIDKLVIDAGNPNVFNPVYDFNTAAAQKLVFLPLSDLSGIVSIIRAGTGSYGPASGSSQARATGSVTISTPNGSTQSVSGEVVLPSGLYYDGGNPDCTGGSCLTVDPLITWDSTDHNLSVIENLTVNPGQVQPGNIGSLTGYNLGFFDFHAAAAYILYLYVDDPGSSLSNVVSTIRAGAGSKGLAPTNRPEARATGSASISLPNGTTQSVSGEVSLPPGLYYTGSTNTGCASGQACLVIDPNIDITNIALDPNSVLIRSLQVDAGGAEDPTTVRPWNFDAAAAYALQKAPDLASKVSIIRAVAGSNGLD